MYLMTCTRPDLAYPLSILARYVAPGRHRPEHMAAAKRVLRYLYSTSGLGLVLGGRSPVVFTGHADASWVDDLATQRSSQGYTFSLGSGSISWRSTRSSSVLCSSCEAEIYAGAMAAQELCWLTYLLTDLGEPPRSPPVLYVDNKAMLALCQEHRLEHGTKHIALRYFFARELQQRGQLRLAYVASEANTADIFTKALPPGDHQRFCTMLACFALLDWSCDLLFSPTLPMGGIHLEAESTIQEFKLFHGRGGLYIGKAVLKNNVFVLDFVPDLGTADSEGIVTFTSWTHPPDLDPDFSPEGFCYTLRLAPNLPSKDMAFEAFIAWLLVAERESGEKLKSFQSDGGGEYTSQRFKQFLAEKGIKRLLSLPYAHQQQGVAERMNRTLQNTMRKLLRGMRLPNHQWPEAMDHAVMLHNLLSSSSLPNNASPHLLWTVKQGSTKMLRVFGCMVQYRPLSPRAGRFSQRAQWGLHLGIERNYNAWKIFDVHSKETVAARDVIFYERLTLPTYLANLEEDRDPTGGFRGDRAFSSAADEADWDEHNVDNASEEAGPLPYCSVPIPMDDENPRESVNAETYFEFADTGYVTPAEVNTNEGERIGPNFIPDPRNRRRSSLSRGHNPPPLHTEWPSDTRPSHRAMDKELKALQGRNTWKVVPIDVARNKTILTGKWVFRVKTKADGTIDKFKARWVARGFDQEHGRNFTETFAPVSRHTSLRILLATAAMKKKKLRQIDVANAFLYAPVDAEIFVELPHGELQRDLTLTVSSTVTQYLGLNIQEEEGVIYLNAAKYADTIAKRFALTPTTISTPYRYTAGNDKAESAPLKPAGIRNYQRKLECLLFAAVTSRPDLSYSASQLATYLKRPEDEHMKELDRALHYLVSTPTIGLIYFKSKTTTPKLIGYVDADHAGDPDNRRSRTGYIYRLEPIGPISWQSSKLELIALSSAEAEYIALCSATKEGLYLRELLEEAKLAQLPSFSLFCDNQSAIRIANKNGFANKTKHIALRYFFVKNEIEKGRLELSYCPTSEMAADYLTKKLRKSKFEYCMLLTGQSHVTSSDTPEAKRIVGNN
ncbi:unnamed protein product [Closterium sp. NIES-53]